MRTGGHLKVVVEAARKAGALLKDNLGNVRKISYKGEINIVTDIDKKSEALIVKFLKSRYPGYGFLTEETAPRKTKSQYKWIIDPLDATTNYAHGFPFFCVSVALEKAGEIIAGAVFDPMRNELFFAEKEKGAYLNGKRISVSKVSDLNSSLLATGFSYRVRQDRTNIVHFENFLMAAQAVRRAGSAALDLCYVACGRFEGFWEMDLKPWDTAAGSLIVEEAGGMLSDFSGGRFNIYSNQTLASNRRIHDAMISTFAEGRI